MMMPSPLLQATGQWAIRVPFGKFQSRSGGDQMKACVERVT